MKTACMVGVILCISGIFLIFRAFQNDIVYIRVLQWGLSGIVSGILCFIAAAQLKKQHHNTLPSGSLKDTL